MYVFVCCCMTQYSTDSLILNTRLITFIKNQVHAKCSFWYISCDILFSYYCQPIKVGKFFFIVSDEETKNEEVK